MLRHHRHQQALGQGDSPLSFVAEGLVVNHKESLGITALAEHAAQIPLASSKLHEN